ncbi:replication protein A 32 kDa subunit [Trichuris trichiura]|uniref:Replication protein A 32 kDa subunit n=1 Tax=Trichuris trichiura TaxID=36087 RepID=A0A077Z3B7_TRITR|nr:replication protein A 32 kDa subunit [Trichuris trichiura]
MLNDYGTGGGGFVSSQTPGRDRKGASKVYRNTQLLPATCAMIHNMTSGTDTLRVGTAEISQVCIVGLVRSIERSAIHTDVLIDDMTSAPLRARQYARDDGRQPDLPSYMGAYVRVCGHISSFQNKKALTVFGIMKLKDLNELTMHILEVVQAKLFFEKDVISQRMAKKTLNLPSTSTDNRNRANPFNAPPAPTVAYSYGLTGLRAEIHRYLRDCTAEEGMSFSELKARFAHVPTMKLKSEVDFLSDEGHIYTTIDEDHFKTTDS